MKTALVDADFLLYYATYPNRRYTSDVDYVLEEKTLEEVYKSVDDWVEEIVTKTESTHYILCLTSRSFRYSLYPDYKGNRKKLDKPKWYSECKEYLKDKHKAYLLELHEADDVVVILKNQIKDSIICSNDKDILKCIEGYHYNTTKKEFVDTTYSEANYNFWVSMIVGDSTDNIKGIPGKGIKFAESYLFGCDQEGLVEFVMSAYISHFKEYQGIIEFTKNYQLLKMLSESLDGDILDVSPIEYKKKEDEDRENRFS